MNLRTWTARLRFLAVMAAAVCLLAGCGIYGATVDTQLKVNEDLSGVRVMDVTIPAGMVSGNSPVTIDVLNRLIEENCPQELTWSYVKNGNTDQYHVELAFDSPADYMVKVKAYLEGMVPPDGDGGIGFRLGEGNPGYGGFYERGSAGMA